MPQWEEGTKVRVHYEPSCPAPGWPRSMPQSFDGVVINPGAFLNWVLVHPNTEHRRVFGDRWFCHPDWLEHEDGPW